MLNIRPGELGCKELCDNNIRLISNIMLIRNSSFWALKIPNMY